MKRRVADIIMDILVESDITDCFCVVGGGAMHLNNALALNDKIRKTFNHHEQACSMAADAYARFSGKTACVCVTSGPGATNALTGVMGAWQDNLPMVVLSGNVRYDISIEKSGLPLRYRGVQEFDIVNSVKNMTKYVCVLKDPLAIRKELSKAIKIAKEGRRGPVWLDIPLDVQSTFVEESELYPNENDDHSIPKINGNELKQVYELLRSAKRPCILAGSGIVSSNTQEAFLEFANKQQVPIVGGAWIADVFYNEHPRFYGLSGNIGPRTGNFILQNADVIFTLGSSLSFNQTGYNVDLFAPKAKIIMVDIDENEAVKHGSKIHTFIHCDLSNLFEKFDENIVAPLEWIEYCNNLKYEFDPYEAIINLNPKDKVCKYHFWKEYDSVAPKDGVLALGNSSCNSAKLQVGKKYHEQRVITNYMCGSMGYDLPAAIGVAVASGKEVICVSGDGSFMMNLQELQTIIHYKLPIKIVIFENAGYNAIRQTCKNFFNGVQIGCSPETGISIPNLENIANSFGFEYKCCHTNEHVNDCLQWLFHQQGNLFLEIKETNDDPMIPKVMARMDSAGKMMSPAIQDMYPFIEEEKLRKLMISEEN